MFVTGENSMHIEHDNKNTLGVWFWMVESLEAIVLREIDGGLWHTTSPEWFEKIIVSGAILPEPDIPDNTRWSSHICEDKPLPYVRFIGGVSLFELVNFDPDGYNKIYPLSSWNAFIPITGTWTTAVWIEIDRELVKENVISAKELLLKRRADNAHRHNFLPMIEAAHIGPIPVTSFKRVFLVNKGDSKINEILLKGKKPRFSSDMKGELFALELDTKQKVLIAIYMENQKDIPKMEDITPELFGISKDAFFTSLKRISDEGLVLGIQFSKGDERIMDAAIDNATMSFQGIEYVESKLGIINTEKPIEKIGIVQKIFQKLGLDLLTDYAAKVTVELIKSQLK